MNTTGFIRGYMAKNMKSERFLKFAAETMSKEFGGSIIVNNICQDAYEVLFRGCKAVITNKKIDELRSKSPYEVDRYLLTRFRSQGLKFDERRSQYIRYCFGH